MATVHPDPPEPGGLYGSREQERRQFEGPDGFVVCRELLVGVGTG